jgi:tetratricopeptide (TPR) repeat protein
MKLIEKYNKALLQKPDEAVYLYNLGCCYHNLRNYDKAIANFEMAIKLD